MLRGAAGNYRAVMAVSLFLQTQTLTHLKVVSPFFDLSKSDKISTTWCLLKQCLIYSAHSRDDTEKEFWLDGLSVEDKTEMASIESSWGRCFWKERFLSYVTNVLKLEASKAEFQLPLLCWQKNLSLKTLASRSKTICMARPFKRQCYNYVWLFLGLWKRIAACPTPRLPFHSEKIEEKKRTCNNLIRASGMHEIRAGMYSPE